MVGLLKREIEACEEYLIDSEVVEVTALERYDELYDNFNLFLKREDMQKIWAFKIRWAFNAISLLIFKANREDIRVSCASAGNHAQGVAIACKHFWIKWTVFMPANAPDVKVKATKKFGWDYVDIVLIWESFDETKAAADEFTSLTDATFIHPFDDSWVIIGTSTIWFEIFEQMAAIGEKVDYILVPVWWGGLIAWIIEAKNLYSPETEIIGVEQLGYPAMSKSLTKWRISHFKNEYSTRFADGTAVGTVWSKTFDIVKRNKTKMITIPKTLLSKYMLYVKEKSGILLEGSWALSLAAPHQQINKFEWKNVVSILSGRNIDDWRSKLMELYGMEYDLKREQTGKAPILQIDS